jgi:Mg-dependent DNase
MKAVRFYDAHCHYSYLKKNYEGYVIAGVSMDYASSVETLSLKSENVIAGVGIHPWKVHEEKLDKIEELIGKADFIGEVGLDYRFAKANKELQLSYFTFFVRKAAENDMLINVHALDAWRDAFNVLINEGVKRAIFHWYSGPEDLLKDIEGAGFYITVNPSVTFQQKHRRLIEKAPVEILLTESDGGYEYRGKLLEPTDIINTIPFVAQLKDIDVEELSKIIQNNFRNAFNLKI